MSSKRIENTDQTTTDSTTRETLEALYESVAQELRHINTTYQGAAAAPALNYGPYHQAAAVLSTFEISKIKPASSADDEKIEDLLADSIVVYDEPKPGFESQAQPTDSEETDESILAVLGARTARWMLLPGIRRRVIEQMATREAFLQALDANPERSNDTMQRMIESYLRNEAPSPVAQTVEELACTAQVVEWFQGRLDNLPDAQTIARQLDAKRQRQPFEKLVGQHFSGRHEQLRILREYVGVLEPTSLWNQLKRRAETFLNWRDKPPLMIHGPGGVGKSTLVAKFILEHTNLKATQRFPYAYLDFDRPGLLAEEPATLLVEAVRQLGIQYPDVQEHSERVRKDWEEELALVARQAQSVGSEGAVLGSGKLSKQQRTTFLRDFDALLNAMGLSDEPFLLVLDTFEEVQYRSHQYIQQLWEALEELQSIVPRLRTVFSGRAPLKDFNTQALPLNDLDAAAAKGFLTASKIEPEKLVDTIVKRIGGNPLSLRLAVQIFHNEGGDSASFFNRLKKGRIQSALYTRVLEHIHDKNVMKLAHPGLILRRITPGLILEVLAEPCGVEVKDLDDAEKLFDKLSQEITLVVPGGVTKDEPLALRHMTEVRRGMIQLLREDDEQKSKVLTIQEKAITYYEPSDDPVSRAEELYHRLLLKQDHDLIAARWIDGAKDHLFNALEELEPKEQAFLAARLNVDVEDDVLAQANQPDWEVLVARRADNFLRLGHPDRALQVLAPRRSYLPGSTLFILEAHALRELGRLAEARDAIARGLHSEPISNAVKFRLLMMDARVGLELQTYQMAWESLMKARALARQTSDNLRLLEAMLGLLNPELTAQMNAGEAQAQLVKELLELLRTIPDSVLSQQLGLVRYTVGRFGDQDDGLVIRAVQLVGFESANKKQLRTLGRALAEWDVTASSAANVDPGLLAKIVRIPLLSEISETWTTFTQKSSAKQIRDVVSLLLTSYQMTPNVRAALIAALRLPTQDEISTQRDPAETILRSGSSRVSTSLSAAPIALSLTVDERQSLVYALTAAFPTRSSLEMMLWYRMNLNLDSLSLTDTMTSTVKNVVRYAETRELLVQLLTYARESNPGNIYLANFARKFGMTPDSGVDEDSIRQAIQAGGFPTVDQWRVGLGAMTGRICRVEVGFGDSAAHATGFLVGPNSLVTTCQVLEGVINGSVSSQDVLFRFDIQNYSGTAINQGSIYKLASENWLIASSPFSTTPDDQHLDFAMVRLDGVPGREPIGGERAEPGAPARGWIAVQPAKAVQMPAPKQVLMLHYSPGESLKLVMSTDEAIRMNDQRTRLYYNIGAESVSAGAPCFDANWELVGFHSGLSPDHSGESYALTVSAVIGELQRAGFDVLGRDKFEVTVLRGDRVFLDREYLRQALREMADPAGRRILVVNGPHGSGKTYTREYVLDVTFGTPNHRVVYLDLDTADYGPAELASDICQQVGYESKSMPKLNNESPERWVARLNSSLLAGLTSNTAIKWWLILDGFTKPLQAETKQLIDELAIRAREADLRMILLGCTAELPVRLATEVIREDIKPIGREDVETFVMQQLTQNDPNTTSTTVKEIVDQVMAAAGDVSAGEGYPTANHLRLLNRALNHVMHREYS